jgi:hypothetical protein
LHTGGISPHLRLQGCLVNPLNHKQLISLNFFFGQPLSNPNSATFGVKQKVAPQF